jgi:hypothetical protein
MYRYTPGAFEAAGNAKYNDIILVDGNNIIIELDRIINVVLDRNRIYKFLLFIILCIFSYLFVLFYISHLRMIS